MDSFLECARRSSSVDEPAFGSSTRQAGLALLLLVPAPSIGTALALHLAPGAVGQTVFAIAKIWLLALPLVWLMAVRKQRPAWPAFRREGWLPAVIVGLVTALAILAAYGLVGRRWIDADQVRRIAFQAGLNSVPLYLAGAIYWILINSLLEEYVWRWFVFRQCQAIMSAPAAVAVAALCFTAHHVIALAAYFDWRVIVLGSLGVCLGGASWSWLYLRYRHIWVAYLAHVLADVPVFLIGYSLIFSAR